MRRCRQGDFFKRLKRLSGSKTRPADTILNEAGQPLQSNEDKLARWRRHFVLNVENAVAAEVITGVVDNMEGPDLPKCKHGYPCISVTDAGTRPTSLAGHGEQKCVCVCVCVCLCAYVLVHLCVHGSRE